jgi:ATP-dependent helicase/nuclease subunit A
MGAIFEPEKYNERKGIMNLTRNQEKVLASQKHLSITANAGSGKTTVLIEKYIRVLDEIVKGYSLDKIADAVKSVVVITFTEKAASELKERVTLAIERRIENARAERRWEDLKKLEEVRDAMPSAIVGTIHSFCARILREFAVTAGVDANFEILEGAERNQAIGLIIERKIKDVFKREDEKAKKLFEIVKKLKIGAFYSLVEDMISSREIIEKIKRDIYSKGDDEIISYWQGKIFKYVEDVFKGSQMVKVLRGLVGHIFAGDEKAIIAGLFESSLQSGDVSRAYRYFCDFVGDIFTVKGELSSKYKKEIERKPEQVQRQIYKEIELVRKVFWDIKDLNLDTFDLYLDDHRQYVEYARLLLSLYDEINDEYENFKIMNGYLDFEDLQLKVSKLLDVQEVQDELAQRFRYIMIDEYQDTNYLQYEIVKKLIGDFSGRTKLFVVGDEKQSIYGFRGSNVEVFDITANEICLSGDGEKIMLDESFRLLRGIAGFVNVVFEKIMGERISIYEVSYSPIVVGRDVDDDGRVEILLVKDEDERGDEGRLKEARFVAKRILALLQDESAYVYRDGVRQGIKPRDIAVLIRNRNILKPIESAFIELGIPYIVSSGIGFYQTQEIYDFINYLKFLVNTNDDVALVGILRSPFFGISDVEIFRVSVYGRGESFWDKVRSFATRVDEPLPSEGLKRAVNLLEEDLKVANKVSIPSLIQRIILNTSYNGSVLPMRRGEQIVANVQKLIDVAREFESRGLNNLYDFVEQLRVLSGEYFREGQASVEPGIDAVQIMTIHAAKGLEFPVVVLPFLGEEVKKKKGRNFNFDVDYGIGFNYEEVKNLPISVVHRLIREHKEIAEEKRVLYVGMTRARDVLILSGVYDEGSKETYLNWILNALDIKGKEDIINDFEVETKLMFKGKTEPQDYNVKVKIFRYGCDFVEDVFYSPGVRVDVGIDEGKIFIKPLESKPYGEFFSATQLQTFALCPMKFYLKFRLGLPEPKREFVFDEVFEDITALPYEDDFKDEIVGTVKGRIVHQVLEKLKVGIDDGRLIELVRSVIYQNGISSEKKSKALEEFVFDEVKRVLNSGFGRRIFSADEHHSEYGISMKFGDSYLMGRIDRMYKVDGQWEIVDFKTDDVSIVEIQEKRVEYEVQLGVYAYLLSRIYPHQESFRSYILFTKFPDSPIEVLHTYETLGEFKVKIEDMISQIKRIDLDVRSSISSDFKEHCKICGYFVNGRCIGREL